MLFGVRHGSYLIVCEAVREAVQNSLIHKNAAEYCLTPPTYPSFMATTF